MDWLADGIIGGVIAGGVACVIIVLITLMLPKAKCPKCGRKILKAAKKCPKCKSPLKKGWAEK